MGGASVRARHMRAQHSRRAHSPPRLHLSCPMCTTHTPHALASLLAAPWRALQLESSSVRPSPLLSTHHPASSSVSSGGRKSHPDPYSGKWLSKPLSDQFHVRVTLTRHIYTYTHTHTHTRAHTHKRRQRRRRQHGAADSEDQRQWLSNDEEKQQSEQ